MGMRYPLLILSAGTSSLPSYYDINMANRNTSLSRFRKFLLDFANVFKAFVGTNYLAVSFAFSQSGILLGSIGIVVIALVTAHCCHLIVKCKREAVRQLLRPTYEVDSTPNRHDAVTKKDYDEREVSVKQSLSRARIKEQIEMHLSYGDVAWVAMGKWGLGIVNFALVVTQIGFCVGFTIFLGNTLQKMFPLVNGTIPVPATTLDPSNSTETDSVNMVITDVTTLVITTAPTNMTNASVLFPPMVPPPHPRYETLVAAMVPLFVLFAFLRNVRHHLGPVSIVANTAVFLAYFAVMAYIIIDFDIDTSVKWVRWTTFPIFFGQLTYAYEGIGTIIPIESSMTGNRHLFAPFLYIGLSLFTVIQASIGIMGYMKYGDATQQIIIWNLPSHSIIPYILDSVICLGVMLTLPLMNYPVIEILEDLLFVQGRIFGPSKTKADPSSGQSTVQTDFRPLEEEDDDEIVAILKRLPVASSIPDSVSAWKRNLFRAILVCAESGIAIAFKNEYAYFSAFVGAVGGTLLAYIIPCVIHLKLNGLRLPLPVIIKDVMLIIFGIIGGVASVFASAVAIFGGL